MPKRKKWKKDKEQSDTGGNKKTESARKARDAFVCISTIATGILMIVAFCHADEVWERYPGWIRTVRSKIPTVAIVRETIAQEIHILLRHPASRYLMGFNFISFFFRDEKYLYENLSNDVAC